MLLVAAPTHTHTHTHTLTHPQSRQSFACLRDLVSMKFQIVSQNKLKHTNKKKHSTFFNLASFQVRETMPCKPKVLRFVSAIKMFIFGGLIFPTEADCHKT